MYSVVQVLSDNNDGTVTVGCSTSACQGCKAEMFCNTKGQTSYLALNEKKLPVKPQDWVEIYLPPGKTISSIFLVFGLPLLLFPLGVVICKHFSDFSDVVCALFGLVFMGFAFCISALISAKNKKKLMPKITKKV